MDVKSIGGFSFYLNDKSFCSEKSSLHIDLTLKIRYNIRTSKTI